MAEAVNRTPNVSPAWRSGLGGRASEAVWLHHGPSKRDAAATSKTRSGVPVRAIPGPPRSSFSPCCRTSTRTAASRPAYRGVHRGSPNPRRGRRSGRDPVARSDRERGRPHRRRRLLRPIIRWSCGSFTQASRRARSPRRRAARWKPGIPLRPAARSRGTRLVRSLGRSRGCRGPSW